MNILKGSSRSRKILAVVVLLAVVVVALIIASAVFGNSELNVSDTIEINRPIEEVFAFLAEPTNYSLWTTGVNKVLNSADGKIDVGTILRQEREFLGEQNVIDLQITEYVPNERISYVVISGPTLGIQAAEYVAPTSDGGTLLTFTSSGQLSGFFGLTAPIAQSLYQRQLEIDMQNLRVLLESGN